MEVEILEAIKKSKQAEKIQDIISEVELLSETSQDTHKSFNDEFLPATIDMGKSIDGIFEVVSKSYRHMTTVDSGDVEQSKPEITALGRIIEILDVNGVENREGFEGLYTQLQLINESLSDTQGIFERRAKEESLDSEEKSMSNLPSSVDTSLKPKELDSKSSKGIFGMVGSLFGSIGKGVAKGGKGVLGLITKIASPILKPVMGALKMAGPVGLVITGIMGLFDAVNGWFQASDITGKSEEALTTFDKIMSAISGMLSGFSFGLVDVKTVYGFLTEKIPAYITEVKNLFSEFVDTFGHNFPLLVEMGTNIKNFFKPIGDWLSDGGFNETLDTVMNVLGKIKDWASGIISAVPETLSGLPSKIMDNVGNTFSNLASNIFGSDKSIDGGKLEQSPVMIAEARKVKQNLNTKSVEMSKKNFDESKSGKEAPIVNNIVNNTTNNTSSGGGKSIGTILDTDLQLQMMVGV